MNQAIALAQSYIIEQITTATGAVGTVSGVPDPPSYWLIWKVCVFIRILTAPLTVFAGEPYAANRPKRP